MLHFIILQLAATQFANLNFAIQYSSYNAIHLQFATVFAIVPFVSVYIIFVVAKLFQFCLASILYWNRQVLHPSCTVSVLSCTRPVLHSSSPTLVQSCTLPVLHSPCPALVLTCTRPYLYPSWPASVLYIIRTDLYVWLVLSSTASDLSYI